MMNAKAIILAAGKGSRLQCEHDEVPKALRRVCGKPLIEYVLEGIDFIAPKDITIVVGVMGQKIIDHLGSQYNYVWQREQSGTANAALCAQSAVGAFDGPVIVLYCDMPLLSRATYKRMIDEHVQTGAKNTLLAARIHPIPQFGRLIYDESGRLERIVEHSACTPEQLLLDEVNVGIQVLDGSVMWDVLHKVGNDNPKHEYYLTGVVDVMYRLGYKQHVVVSEDSHEYWGVNTMDELLAVEKYLEEKKQAR